MDGDNSEFKNAQYLVDTADLRHFLICRYIEKDVKALPFPSRHSWQIWGASVSCHFWGYCNGVWAISSCPANCVDGLPLPSL